MDDFLARCFYQPGQYKSEADFSTLADRMSEFEGVRTSDHLMGDTDHSKYNSTNA